MITNSKEAERQAVVNAAYALCAAARTAPKACGEDIIETAVITDGEKDALTAEMRRLSSDGGEFFARDADNVDACTAVVLIGAKEEARGLGKLCKLCHFEDCGACGKADAACVFPPMDLGIALGSAVALAADLRIDNRIMFTIGKAASALGLLGEHRLIMGIPLSASGKSPFFDRK